MFRFHFFLVFLLMFCFPLIFSPLFFSPPERFFVEKCFRRKVLQSKCFFVEIFPAPEQTDYHGLWKRDSRVTPHAAVVAPRYVLFSADFFEPQVFFRLPFFLSKNVSVEKCCGRNVLFVQMFSDKNVQCAPLSKEITTACGSMTAA